MRKLTMNNEKLNLRVGFHRKHSVPEGGELCLTACVAKRNLRYPMAINIVLEEGELHFGLWGIEVLRLYGMTVKPHNLTTVKPHNRKRCSPPSGTGGLVLNYRKFRFATHAVKHSSPPSGTRVNLKYLQYGLLFHC